MSNALASLSARIAACNRARAISGNTGVSRLWLRDRTGTTAAEFALVLPLFTAIVLGIIEFGIVFFVYADMYASAATVARQVAVNQLDVSRAADATRSILPGWAVAASTVTVSQSNVGDPSTNIISINVQAPVNRITPISIFTRMAP
jgi:Flp pilus assembly protein TadG